MPAPILTIRNSRDSGRSDRAHLRREITWVPGTIRPHASLWITVQRLLVLNRPSATDFFRIFVPSSRSFAVKPNLDQIRRSSSHVSLLRMARVLHESPTCFAGSQASQYPQGVWSIFGKYMAWCPQCLAEGFHSVLFSIHGLERCPIHGNELWPTLPCDHAVAHGYLGSSLLKPGCCEQCGASFLSEPVARQVGHHSERDRRLGELSKWLHETGCWRRFKIEPPCRSKFEPGLDAVRRTVVCG